MAGWSGWESQVLTQIGAPVTAANVAFLDSWQGLEGGTAAYNPLNTTHTAGGSWAYNSLGNGIGVQNYPNPSTGAQATAATLLGGYYPNIVAALQSGNPFASQWSAAIAPELKTWSGGGYSAIPGSAPANASQPASTSVTPASGSSGGPSVNFTSQGLTMAVVVVALLLVLTGLGQFTGSRSAAA